MLIATAAINVGTQGKTFVFKLAYNILILLSRVVYSLLGNTVSIVFLSTVVYLLFFALEMQKRYYVFLCNVEQIPKPLK